jgi:hypothetical protein
VAQPTPQRVGGSTERLIRAPLGGFAGPAWDGEIRIQQSERDGEVMNDRRFGYWPASAARSLR